MDRAGIENSSDRVHEPPSPPWWVVVGSLFLGVVLVGGTTYGGRQLVAPPVVEAPAAAPAPVHVDDFTAPAPLQTAPTPSSPQGWQALLRGMSCEVPCAGGVTCAAQPAPCTSGLTCIPGSGREELLATENWMLHLSAVRVLSSGLEEDPCQTRRDFWVCRVGTEQCLSQREACRGAKPAGLSSEGLPIAGSEFGGQFVLEVREGGPQGPVLAVTNPIPRQLRSGLCRGYRVKARGNSVNQVSYFLLPP